MRRYLIWLLVVAMTSLAACSPAKEEEERPIPAGVKAQPVEHSTAESEAIVRRVTEYVRASAQAGAAVRPEQQAIYDVDYLMLEVGSGASFEQYFRWATVEQINRVVPALRLVGLSDIAELTEQAIAVAFPQGVPASDLDKDNLTNWTKEQEKQLGGELFRQFESNVGRITNVLAAYAKRTGAAQHGNLGR